MGERDRGLEPPPPPPPWPQRAVLAGALAALLVAVLLFGPVETTAAAGRPALLTRLLEASLAALLGERAPAVLGVLMLALAAVFVCRPLERRIGSSAPLLVTLLIFGSASWALVWTAGAALVPLALAVAAFALAYEGGGVDEGPAEIYQPRQVSLAEVGRWLAVGLLLAELVPSAPLLAGLLLPAALAVPRARRGALLPLLLGGFGLALAGELLIQGTGFLSQPMDVAAATISLDPALAGRNLVRVVAGRDVGLLVGFAPLLLLLALGRGSAARPALAPVGVALPLVGVLLLPFDWAAGWLNLSFVPVYGALWHLPRLPPRRWQWAAVMLLCALATWPLWVMPRRALEEGGVRLAAAWPRRVLPYEAALRSLPNRGEAELARQGLRVRAVAGCRLVGDAGRFELAGAGSATIWLAAPEATAMVALELGPGAPSSIEVAGATAGRTVFRPDGRVGFEVLLSEPRGQHRLWFGERSQAVHLIEVRFPGRQRDAPLRFRILAAPQP